MEELTAQGKSIILISSYLPEVMGLSDRLIVMAQGKITGEFASEELKNLREEDVLKRASIESRRDIMNQAKKGKNGSLTLSLIHIL